MINIQLASNMQHLVITAHGCLDAFRTTASNKVLSSDAVSTKSNSTHLKTIENFSAITWMRKLRRQAAAFCSASTHDLQHNQFHESKLNKKNCLILCYRDQYSQIFGTPIHTSTQNDREQPNFAWSNNKVFQGLSCSSIVLPWFVNLKLIKFLQNSLCEGTWVTCELCPSLHPTKMFPSARKFSFTQYAFETLNCICTTLNSIALLVRLSQPGNYSLQLPCV